MLKGINDSACKKDGKDEDGLSLGSGGGIVFEAENSASSTTT
jgi:hypothetical protein